MLSQFIQKAYAQGINSGKAISAETLIGNILTNIVNPIITLMVAVAVVIFLWGVFQFIKNAESPEDRKTGGMHMLFGAIGLFVMSAAYGIMNLIIGTIGE